MESGARAPSATEPTNVAECQRHRHHCSDTVQFALKKGKRAGTTGAPSPMATRRGNGVRGKGPKRNGTDKRRREGERNTVGPRVGSWCWQMQ